MELVLDIGNFQLKGALFEDGVAIESFRIPFDPERLKNGLKDKSIEFACVSSVNAQQEEPFFALLNTLSIPYKRLKREDLSIELDVDEPEALGEDRIANVYGALAHFPQNDCIVVDMGSAVTFDCIGMSGRYVGGAIYPGVYLGAKALNSFTSKLPLVEIEKPDAAIAKDTKTHIQSGLYWGLLGAIERITDQIRAESQTPSNVKVIATGGLLSHFGDAFAEDLGDLVDLIDPLLTLNGLYQILKEMKKDV